MDILSLIEKVLPFLKRSLADREVNDAYLAKSGLADRLEKAGYRKRWVAKSKVQERLLEGWEYVYEDKFCWWRNKLRMGNLVLLKLKKKT